MAPEDVDRLETILFDLVTVGAQFYPPMAIAVPLFQSFVKYETAKIRAGLADGSIISDNQGGFVSKEWAEDQRHQLNRDGTFKDKSW
jgi:hypothetical protein